MLHQIVNRFPEEMSFNEKPPLVSIYQTTHRTIFDQKKDLLVFKNLVKEVENALFKYDVNDATMILKRLNSLNEDKEFWDNNNSGIAIFVSKDKCIVYRLVEEVKELAVVGNSYHVTPLIKAYQFNDTYQLLGLSRDYFTIYQGNRYAFKEMEIDKSVFRTKTEVLGDQLTESYFTHGTYGGAKGPSMYHGHKDIQQEIDKDTLKYFRYVDNFVYEQFSKKSKLPLMLVALKEHQGEFRSLTNNPYLISENITISSEAMSIEALHQKTIMVIDEINDKKINKAITEFQNQEARSLGSTDIAQVAKAAFEGRVETLLIEENAHVYGKMDLNSGKIEFMNDLEADNNDILDDLAEMVMLKGGKVLVVSKDKLLSSTGLAAIFRYNM